MLGGIVGDRIQRIEGAGARGAGVADNGEYPPTSVLSPRMRRAEFSRVETELCVRRHRNNPIGPKPEDAGGAVVRIVCLVRDEDRQRRHVGHAPIPDVQLVDRLSGCGESGQIAGGTA